MQVYQNIIQLLETQQIPFRSLEHEPTPTSMDSARVRGEDIRFGAKAIVLKVQDQFYLFVMSASKRIQPNKIRTYFKEHGRKAKKLRFASPEELWNLTGLVPGAVPPFGEPILKLEIFVDESIIELSHISFNAGSLTHSVSISAEDYIKLSNPIVFDFTA